MLASASGSIVKAARGPGKQKSKGVSKIRTSVARFDKDESGALIAAGIAVAILVAVNSVGSSLTTMFNTISTDLKPK
jgi:pilus assembly protein Flp/PilA